MSSDDIAISVRSLGKTYRLFGHPGDRIKQFLSLGMKKYHNEFTALHDVSFDIKKGETVGIIGRNGSGKSTLLQLICGILKPTAGSVKVNGRISALLELGAGFNPEFTGRENVYFQGAVIGISKEEMDARFDEIAAFADIGEFIDQPVRTYSSGMFVRLAFSVAVHVAPEILIVDEALGVGDTEFQERSISFMKAMQQKGVTILFVSHSIPAVRSFCQRTVWLEHGTVNLTGDASDVCIAYQEEIGKRLQSEHQRSQTSISKAKHHPSGREKLISIVSVSADQSSVAVGGSLELQFQLHFSEEFSSGFGFGVIIHNAAGRLVTLFNTVRDDVLLSGQVKRINLNLPRIRLSPGRYWISVRACDCSALFAYDEMDHCFSFDVTNEWNKQGIPRWEGDVACEHVWRW